MDIKPYYKTSGGEVVVELEQQNELWLSFKNIVELVLPAGCVVVDCSNNQLKELIIPDDCKDVYCYNNQLSELILSAGCKYIYCGNNQLKKLIIPDSCVEVVADMKSVTELNKVNVINLWI